MNSLSANFFIALLALLTGMASAAADDSGVVDGKRLGGPTPLSKEQRTTALKFAQKHHPELATLLKRLQSKSAPEFQRGIKTLHTAALRIEKLKDRQPARFEAELELWKTDSQIRLLSAKWIVSPNDRLKKQIKQLLVARQAARRERAMSERDRLSDRLKALKAQLDQSPKEQTEAIEAEWDQLTRRARRSKPQKTNNETSRSDSKPKSKETPKKKKKDSSQASDQAMPENL